MYSTEYDTNMRRARLLGKEHSIVTEKALKCKGMVSYDGFQIASEGPDARRIRSHTATSNSEARRGVRR
jgi:hypothetical protein